MPRYFLIFGQDKLQKKMEKKTEKKRERLTSRFGRSPLTSAQPAQPPSPLSSSSYQWAEEDMHTRSCVPRMPHSQPPPARPLPFSLFANTWKPLGSLSPSGVVVLLLPARSRPRPRSSTLRRRAP